MRASLTIALAAAGVAAALPAGSAARPAPRPPSQRQIAGAVRRAERSPALWATVNVCNTRRYPHMVGIRGEIPSLGFPARLSMDIQVDYWAGSQRGFVADPDPRARKHISLGTQSHGLEQAGYTFTFAPPAILSGTITFRWSLGNRVIGHATRLTAHGVHNVDGGDPRGYSTATCRILQ